MSEHGARAHRQTQIRGILLCLSEEERVPNYKTSLGEIVDVNELRAQRAAASQHDFPLGNQLSQINSMNGLLTPLVQGPAMRLQLASASLILLQYRKSNLNLKKAETCRKVMLRTTQ